MKEAGNVTITILADNAATPPYRAEHGFSALVETQREDGATDAVLFDTGMGALFDNALSACVDLSRVEDVVLSHGHYDHTDALSDFLSRVPEVRVHASAEFFREHYSMRTGTRRSIGLSETNRTTLAAIVPDRFLPFHGETRILDGTIGLSEDIPRNHPLEVPSSLLFADEPCTIPDAVPDELVLWMETPEGIVILTGCCHAGLINTCERVRELSGFKPIRAVIGGFHLAHVSKARLEATASYITAQNIARVVACHCTGDDEIDWLRSRLGAVVTKGECGMTILL